MIAKIYICYVNGQGHGRWNIMETLSSKKNRKVEQFLNGKRLKGLAVKKTLGLVAHL